MRAKYGAATMLVMGALVGGMLVSGRPAWSAADDFVQWATSDPGQAAVRITAGSFRSGSSLDYSSAGTRAVAPQRSSGRAAPAVDAGSNAG